MKRGLFGRCLFAGVVLVLGASLGGCMTMYVDAGLKDANVSQVRKPARAQDAQLLFTFQTKGTNNARATEALKADVTSTVGNSGLFAVVGSDPALSGAIVSVTINNVVLTDDAVAKGFVTGLTLGLAGSTVSDGYVCTIEYTPPSNGQKISRVTKTVNHAIHSTVGARGAPPNAIKAKNPEEAVRTMTRQVVTAALKELSLDPVFN